MFAVLNFLTFNKQTYGDKTKYLIKAIDPGAYPG